MKTSLKGALTSTVVTAFPLSGTPSATAADAIYDLPVGTACEDFNVRLEVADPGREERFRTDNRGVLRSITAGKGNLLTFTNFGANPEPEDWVAGESITVKTGGSVERRVYNDDGTQTITGTGHNLIVLFPGDIPAGPSTILYVGKVVFNFDPDTGFTEIVSFTGRKRDICAELAS